MFLVTYDTVFSDRMTNPILIEMFKIINNRRINKLIQIYPVSKRPDNYIHCVKHHIIPKSWYFREGFPVNNTEYNLINLTIIEHIKVHMLLAKYFDEKNDVYMKEAMYSAVACILGQNKKDPNIFNIQIENPEIQKILDDVYKQKALKLSKDYSETRYINNGQIQIRIKKDEKLPDGFVEGYLSSAAHIKWIHCGEHELRIKPNDIIPSGYIPGRAPSKIKKLQSNALTWGDQVRNKIWYNNGISQIKLSKNDKIPDGFIKGKLPDNKQFITNGKQNKKIGFDEPIPDGWWVGQSTKGFICVNDGKKMIKVHPSSIPPGFKIGKLTSNIKNRIAVSNDTTHHYTMIQKKDLKTYLANGYVKGNHCKKWLSEGYKKIPGYKNKGFFKKDCI